MGLEKRIKELIAVGASVTANCQPCLEYHVGKARENGSNESEIREAIETGKLVRKGAASKMDKLILQLGESTPSGANVPDKGCGCNS